MLPRQRKLLRRKNDMDEGEESRDRHVLPINDLREHKQSVDCKCWCNPRIEQGSGDRVIIHNIDDAAIAALVSYFDSFSSKSFNRDVNEIAN